MSNISPCDAGFVPRRNTIDSNILCCEMVKIALFLPPNFFYVKLFFSMKKALEAHGFHVMGRAELLVGDALLEFCRQSQPDIILEMNRTRNEVPELPKHIVHIGWIVDNLGKKINTFSGSELLYLFWHNWIKDCRSPSSRVVDWLPPGFDQELYFPESRNFLSDISFVGHISFPWSTEEKKRILFESPELIITFEDALRHLEYQAQWVDLTGYNEDDFIEMALAFLPAQVRDRISLDSCVQYDLGCRAILRMAFRQKMLDLVVASGASMRFFGTGGWNAWPQYQFFYQIALTDPADVRAVYQSSKINLHEGVGVHFRTLDCMASGGLLFFMASPDDARPGGIQTFFTPGKHYVAVDENDFLKKTAFYLAHPEERKQICDQAYQEVMEKHTWIHRIQKIVDDLNTL